MSSQFGAVFSWGQHSDGAVVEFGDVSGRGIIALSGGRAGAVSVVHEAGVAWIVAPSLVPGAGGGDDAAAQQLADIQNTASALQAVQVEQGDVFGALLTRDGSLFTWGDNALGACGQARRGAPPCCPPPAAAHLTDACMLLLPSRSCHTCARTIS